MCLNSPIPVTRIEKKQSLQDSKSDADQAAKADPSEPVKEGTTTINKKSTSPPVKPMTITAKSADGKPRNIQITTLSTTVPLTTEPPAPEIKVRSADGKPKKIQFTTLATFTSPKSKGLQESVASSSPVTVKRVDNDDDDCIVVENVGVPGTPKSDNKNTTGSEDKKQTPKRVQLTTLQLYDVKQSPKQSPGKT